MVSSDHAVRPKLDHSAPRTPNSLDRVDVNRFRNQRQAGLASKQSL